MVARLTAGVECCYAALLRWERIQRSVTFHVCRHRRHRATLRRRATLRHREILRRRATLRRLALNGRHRPVAGSRTSAAIGARTSAATVTGSRASATAVAATIAAVSRHRRTTVRARSNDRLPHVERRTRRSAVATALRTIAAACWTRTAGRSVRTAVLCASHGRASGAAHRGLIQTMNAGASAKISASRHRCRCCSRERTSSHLSCRVCGAEPEFELPRVSEFWLKRWNPLFELVFPGRATSRPFPRPPACRFRSRSAIALARTIAMRSQWCLGPRRSADSATRSESLKEPPARPLAEKLSRPGVIGSLPVEKRAFWNCA